MSKNWDTLIENHFAKKKERSRLTLKKLLGTVTEVMGDISVKDEYLLTEEAQTFSMSIPIPRLTPSEAWGNPNSQSRKDIDRIFSSITRKSGDMKGRIAHVATFLDPAEAVKKAPGGQVNTLLNMMQIIEALQATINDFNESSAGFVFEGFMAALTGGRQEAGRVGGTLPIEDFITADKKNVSLKLLSPATPIHGSFTNLIDYLFIRGNGGVENIKYLIARKDDEDNAIARLSFQDFLITRKNLVEILQMTGNNEEKLLGDQADALREQIAKKGDGPSSPQWNLEMKNVLFQTPGYNQTLGMFKKNLTDDDSPEGPGEFILEPPGTDGAELAAKKSRAFAKGEGRGRISNIIASAEPAGALAFQTGDPLDKFLKDVDWSGVEDLPRNPESETRKKRLAQVKISWEKGYEEASKQAQEKESPVVAESYFGAFHEDEKKWRVIDEQTALFEGILKEDADAGGKQFSISNTAILDIQNIASTQYYGVLDLSQDNINQLVEIYIKKLGDDLIKLLQTTKDFSLNIGKYFSEDDRAAASTANQTARDKGKEIIKGLEEREKPSDVQPGATGRQVPGGRLGEQKETT